MTKGQASKLHEVVVNVPVDANKTYDLLPSDKKIIVIKRKEKISFKDFKFLV